MANYISTYFYNDTVDLGAQYGNIDLPLVARNNVYWRTVYTFFHTSITFNREAKHLLFTNVKVFPVRKQLEDMGVQIIDTLQLTHRGRSKWATVKFFFDVLAFIETENDFFEDDNFILLDTDVVCSKPACEIFNLLDCIDRPIAYSFHKANSLEQFHDLNISDLENIGSKMMGRVVKISSLIGGEFYAIKKKVLKKYNEYFRYILEMDSDSILTTEEHILTLVNSNYPFVYLNFSIYRFWTTIRELNVPKNYGEYIFWHLPSEKEAGLDRLYKIFTKNNSISCDEIHTKLALKNVFCFEKIKKFLIIKYSKRLTKQISNQVFKWHSRVKIF